MECSGGGKRTNALHLCTLLFVSYPGLEVVFKNYYFSFRLQIKHTNTAKRKKIIQYFFKSQNYTFAKLYQTSLESLEARMLFRLLLPPFTRAWSKTAILATFSFKILKNKLKTFETNRSRGSCVMIGQTNRDYNFK